jgi:hypothetical protein
VFIFMVGLLDLISKKTLPPLLQPPAVVRIHRTAFGCCRRNCGRRFPILSRVTRRLSSQRMRDGQSGHDKKSSNAKGDQNP